MTAEQRERILREVKVTPENVHYLLALLIECQEQKSKKPKEKRP